MKYQTLLKSLGILLFLAILSRLDFSALKSSFSKFNVSIFIYAEIVTFATVLFQSLRWREMLRTAGFRLPVGKCFAIYLSSSFLGSFTPARIGEFTRVFYLKEYGVPLERAFITVLFDRLFDIAFVILMGFFCLAVLNLQTDKYFLFALSISIPLLIFAALNKKAISFMKTAAGFITPKRFRASSGEIISYIPVFLSEIRFCNFLVLAGCSAAAWLIYLARMYMLALSIGLGLPPLYVCAFVIASSLVMLIPITIQGIGTRDVTFIALFSLVGASREAAVSYSLCILCANLIFQLLSSVAFLFVPMNVSQLES